MLTFESKWSRKGKKSKQMEDRIQTKIKCVFVCMCAHACFYLHVYVYLFLCISGRPPSLREKAHRRFPPTEDVGLKNCNNTLCFGHIQTSWWIVCWAH